MPNVTVTIGTDSVITANNANSIVSLGSNSDDAIMLSKTLKYIYTSVKSDINFNATKQETNVMYDVSSIYAQMLSVYEFSKFLTSRGYVISYIQVDGTTPVATQSYANDDAIKANLYSTSNQTGIKYVKIDWSSPASASDYVITITA